MSKWTEETKAKAVEMLRNKISAETIMKEVEMSWESIRLLKYSAVKTDSERVKCQICGKILKQIMTKHLNRHGISLEEYKTKYPNAKTITDYRRNTYQSFKHPNKGKTYKEIYGAEEALSKREKISTGQIGRKAALLAGTGITGTRKDTGMFARSTYEANIDRIFQFENKRIEGEFSKSNPRVMLVKKDGTKASYQPDRVDVDGLFYKEAFLEIKGYMYPEDWEKICLFREQNPDKKLIVISEDEMYRDINYAELEKKYKDKILLWETDSRNYKKTPEFYDINYVEPSIVKFYNESYVNSIYKDIVEEHLIFIAKKCIAYCLKRFGKRIYVDMVDLKFIAGQRPGARVSTGRYNYELWEITTHDNEKYYVTNQDKTTTFYCYEERQLKEISVFFENNNDPLLKFGAKKEFIYTHISHLVVEKFERKDILDRVENIFAHKAIPHIVKQITLARKEAAKRQDAGNDREEWLIKTEKEKWEYRLTNFGNSSTSEYNLIETVKDIA